MQDYVSVTVLKYVVAMVVTMAVNKTMRYNILEAGPEICRTRFSLLYFYYYLHT